MNLQTLNSEVFFDSLTEKEADVCEADEKQLGEIFKAGWSEATSVRFARVMSAARVVAPAATVEGVLETVLRLGLDEVLGVMARQSPTATPPPRKRRVRGERGVRGVQKRALTGTYIRES